MVLLVIVSSLGLVPAGNIKDFVSLHYEVFYRGKMKNCKGAGQKFTKFYENPILVIKIEDFMIRASDLERDHFWPALQSYPLVYLESL
jgi:hypothetical protein